MLILYKTDNHHSYASRDLIGVSTDPQVVINLCKEQAKKEGVEISNDDYHNLYTIKQTQNYEGEGEFQYEYVKENVLL